MNIIFIAPPAAGKGTFSTMLKEKYGYKHISIGELFRDEVRNKTELGEYLDEKMKRGELVDDSITKKVLENKLSTLNKEESFILDGYPRTMKQVPDYEDILTKLNLNVDKIIFINIDKKVGLKRKLSRLTCPKCKKGYNSENPNLTPKVENICDDCGSELTTRKDDTKEAYEELYKIYESETKPLIEYFKTKGNLITINGELTPIKVFTEIEESLGVKND